MTSNISYFTVDVGGGSNDVVAAEPLPFDEVLNWSVTLMFELDDSVELPVGDDRRLAMLRSLRGLSPVLSVNDGVVVVTLLASGTREAAAMRGLEAGWTCLDAGGVTGSVMGVSLISHEEVDAAVDAGVPFVATSETAGSVEIESALRSIRMAKTTEDTGTSVVKAESMVKVFKAMARTSGSWGHATTIAMADVCPTIDTVPAPADEAVVWAAFTERFASRISTIEGPQIDWASVRLATDTALGMVRTDGIVNQKGAAEILGVSRQRAHQILRGPGAPEPWTYLDGNPLWLRCQIEVLSGEREAKKG